MHLTNNLFERFLEIIHGEFMTNLILMHFRVSRLLILSNGRDYILNNYGFMIKA